VCSLEIAITEYNYGDDSISTSALSMAEVFAIMAREGLAVSNRFANERTNTAPYQSYLFYRNYDGKGSKVTGDSVYSAAKADLNYLTIYSQHDLIQNLLFVKLFNKDATDSIKVAVTLSHIQIPNSGSVGVIYQFQAIHNQVVTLRPMGQLTMTSGSGDSATFTITLPVRTATLIVFSEVTESHQPEVEAD